MDSVDISNAKNPDLRSSREAIQRAADLARRTAIETETDLVIVKDGKTVRISAEELREQSRLASAPAD